jgi:hypothetical protein
LNLQNYRKPWTLLKKSRGTFPYVLEWDTPKELGEYLVIIKNIVRNI